MIHDIKFTDLKLEWINKPKNSKIESGKVSIITDPQTDFWQRTYYGFQNNNAPALLSKIADKYFSFVVKTEFNSKQRYDQCGVIIYQNSDNWFKASIEYENDFCIESSYDGINYKQMRIFHLFSANETINIGIYACSPENSSFCAEFTEIEFMESKWGEHK